MTARATDNQAKPGVRGGAGASGDWVTLPATLARCLAAVRAGEAVRRRAQEEGRRAGALFAEGFRRLTLGG